MKSFKNAMNHGGILIIAIVATVLLSLLSLQLLSDYQRSTQFSIQTKEYYYAKIMKNMILNELKKTQNMSKLNANRSYSKGTVMYRLEKDQIMVTVIVNQKNYYFVEKITRNNTK